jgi:hypothetical protein
MQNHILPLTFMFVFSHMKILKGNTMFNSPLQLHVFVVLGIDSMVFHI